MDDYANNLVTVNSNPSATPRAWSLEPTQGLAMHSLEARRMSITTVAFGRIDQIAKLFERKVNRINSISKHKH